MATRANYSKSGQSETEKLFELAVLRELIEAIAGHETGYGPDYVKALIQLYLAIHTILPSKKKQ